MLGIVATQQFMDSFRDFPPRQRPASFTIDQMMEPFYRGQKAP